MVEVLYMRKQSKKKNGKSEPAKECVTTHRTNGLALKMDGGQASYL